MTLQPQEPIVAAPLKAPLAALDSPLLWCKCVCVCVCVSLVGVSGRRSSISLCALHYASLPLLWSLSFSLKGGWMLKSNCHPLPPTSLLSTFSKEVSSRVNEWKGEEKEKGARDAGKQMRAAGQHIRRTKICIYWLPWLIFSFWNKNKLSSRTETAECV